jgi:hypothetical protein
MDELKLTGEPNSVSPGVAELRPPVYRNVVHIEFFDVARFPSPCARKTRMRLLKYVRSYYLR